MFRRKARNLKKKVVTCSLNFVSFLSILDTIELTVVKINKNLDRILNKFVSKGKKKALAIIELDFYARAYNI